MAGLPGPDARRRGVAAEAAARPPGRRPDPAGGRGGRRLVVRTDQGTTSSDLRPAGAVGHGGRDAEHLTGTPPAAPADLPATLTLADLVTLNRGRIPVGIDARRNPGPYSARWSPSSSLDVWTVDGVLLDAVAEHSLVVTVAGGGLPTPRTWSVTAGAVLPGGVGTAPTGWTVDRAYVDQVSRTLQALAGDRAEARFWGRVVPGVLLVTAAVLLHRARRRRRASTVLPVATAGREPGTADPTTTRSTIHAG